jgi:hypothetical protein
LGRGLLRTIWFGMIWLLATDRGSVELLKESGPDAEAAKNGKGQPFMARSGSPVDDEIGFAKIVMLNPFRLRYFLVQTQGDALRACPGLSYLQAFQAFPPAARYPFRWMRYFISKQTRLASLAFRGACAAVGQGHCVYFCKEQKSQIFRLFWGLGRHLASRETARFRVSMAEKDCGRTEKRGSASGVTAG